MPLVAVIVDQWCGFAVVEIAMFAFVSTSPARLTCYVQKCSLSTSLSLSLPLYLSLSLSLYLYFFAPALCRSFAPSLN